MSKKHYRWLVPEKLPSPLVARRREEYDECIKEFLDSGLETARVNIPNAKPKSLYRQLDKTLRKKGLRESIRVCIRRDKVFLVRIK